MTTENPVVVGQPVPGFTIRSLKNPRFEFSSVAGRPVLLALVDAGEIDDCQKLLDTVLAFAPQFDDQQASLFLVLADDSGLTRHNLRDRIPGIRCLFDGTGHIRRLFGLGAQQPSLIGLDRHLRLLATAQGQAACDIECRRLIGLFETMANPPLQATGLGQAPVLVKDRIFEPELCDELMRHYRLHGGSQSGVMRELHGKTIGVLDPHFKRRQDCTVRDPALLRVIDSRIRARIFPLIRQAWHFEASEIERYLIGRYSGEDRGFFRPHRDNTTPATQHRRFAVTLNLNDEFEGGELHFPEYGDLRYRAPRGGIVVFSGSLLHGVHPVTRGERFAFLPFLFTKADMALRQEGLLTLSS